MIKVTKRKKWFYENATWILFLIMAALPLIDIRFGILGLLSMFIGLGFSLFTKGKPYCAYYCPRGGALKKLLAKISFGKSVPKFISNRYTRYGLTLLLTIKTISGLMKAESLTELSIVAHMGFIATTLIALALGIVTKPRAYCSDICHVGNIAWITNKVRRK
ncbi:MAG: hypothetical protein DSY38_04445 [Fusobacteria bacterium]|nr:MAG: hypothetical protein DSY38_04445 [Fusobacteriota bacterium]